MKLRTGLLTAWLLTALLPVGLLSAAPASAQDVTGVVLTTVTLRAGPGVGFPAVDRVPRGAEVIIHGCLSGGTWCDVSVGAERGWIAAAYLPDHIHRVGVPVVTFTVGTYWGLYYFGRPWFHRHAYWNRYWRTHPPAMQAQTPPQQPSGAVAGPRGTAAMPAQGAATAMPRGGTVGLAATPHVMQPNMKPAGGPATAMHGQMRGMAFAPVGAMPHAVAAGGRGMQSGGGHGGFGHRH